VAKTGFARAAAFPIVRKRKGDCGRAACSLVALDSLTRGSRGHSGADSRLSTLSKEKDKATRVCLEHKLFEV
jgi:hypothetical protein